MLIERSQSGWIPALLVSDLGFKDMRIPKCSTDGQPWLGGASADELAHGRRCAVDQRLRKQHALGRRLGSVKGMPTQVLA